MRSEKSGTELTFPFPSFFLMFVSAGTGQAQPPGIGFRTGAPGKFITKGTGSYRIVDEQVRIFIGPGFQEEGKSTFLRSEVSSVSPLLFAR